MSHLFDPMLEPWRSLRHEAARVGDKGREKNEKRKMKSEKCSIKSQKSEVRGGIELLFPFKKR